MLGHKARDFRKHISISIEDLVPQDNFYRQVERISDLSFVRDLADEFYSSMGRPSVDPVVFFKLQLIAFFEGIRSERQLMETVNSTWRIAGSSAMTWMNQSPITAA